MSTELTHYEETGGLAQFKAPEKVLEEAKRAAEALTKVIALKKKPVIFNNEQYLEFEDWQTVSRFYGCTVKIESTNFVQFGDVRGFEATAVVLDREQREISRAESMCLSDEDNWGEVPQYEWHDELDENGKKIWVDVGGRKRPKSKKVQVGSKPKPLFQLRSMAQTRASARALRQVFAWVVVLAGYQPTPAEEMTGDEEPRNDADRDPRPPVQQPQRASEKKQEPPKQNGEGQKPAQAQQPPPAELVEFSEKIESAKLAEGGEILWLTTKGHGLVAVRRGQQIPEMVAGNMIAVSAKKMNHKQIGDYWMTFTVHACAPIPATTEDVQEAEYEDVGGEGVADTPPAGLDNLFEGGEVKTGDQVQASGGKVIGASRARRLHAIITTSQREKKSEFTEEHLKAFKARLNLERTENLPVEMYDDVCAYADGSNLDWKQMKELSDLKW